jgi:hypothetical protein
VLDFPPACENKLIMVLTLLFLCCIVSLLESAMVTFYVNLGRLECLGVWSNTVLDIAVKVFCICD